MCFPFVACPDDDCRLGILSLELAAPARRLSDDVIDSADVDAGEMLERCIDAPFEDAPGLMRHREHKLDGLEVHRREMLTLHPTVLSREALQNRVVPHALVARLLAEHATGRRTGARRPSAFLGEDNHHHFFAVEDFLVVLDPLLGDVERTARDIITPAGVVVADDASPIERGAADELLDRLAAHHELFLLRLPGNVYDVAHVLPLANVCTHPHGAWKCPMSRTFHRPPHFMPTPSPSLPSVCHTGSSAFQLTLSSPCRRYVSYGAMSMASAAGSS